MEVKAIRTTDPQPQQTATARVTPKPVQRVRPKSTSSLFASRSNDTLIVEAADIRQATRRIALQMELQLMGEQPFAKTTRRMSRWLNGRHQHRAPGAIVRNYRTARYRMPRQLKRKLIDQLCAPDGGLTASPPSVMIIAAHQDDESVGAGSRLCKLTEAYVVHVTDGAPRDPAVAHRFGFATREEYAEARWQELLRAMRIAGVPEDRLIHLGYIDGEPAFRMVDLVVDIAQLLDDYAPDIVITHPYEGGHTDHDATAFAVHLACGLLRREGVQPPAVLEMTSYHDRDGSRVVHDFLPHEPADTLRRAVVLSQEEQEVKQQMFECFTSQHVALSSFSTAIEKFRPAPRYVFTRPPHSGMLNYEKYGDPDLGERWRHNAGLALNELHLRSA
ncbi:MAG: PIG-L deacetylase family protein [Gemmatimonadota bacterium]